jgi:hypothetical protein
VVEPDVDLLALDRPDHTSGLDFGPGFELPSGHAVETPLPAAALPSWRKLSVGDGAGLLAVASVLQGDEIGDRHRTAQAIGDRQNEIRIQRGAAPIRWIEPTGYRDVVAALHQIPPAELARALDLAGFEAKEKRTSKYLDPGMWATHRLQTLLSHTRDTILDSGKPVQNPRSFAARRAAKRKR